MFRTARWGWRPSLSITCERVPKHLLLHLRWRCWVARDFEQNHEVKCATRPITEKQSTSQGIHISLYLSSCSCWIHKTWSSESDCLSIFHHCFGHNGAGLFMLTKRKSCSACLNPNLTYYTVVYPWNFLHLVWTASLVRIVNAQDLAVVMNHNGISLTLFSESTFRPQTAMH